MCNCTGAPFSGSDGERRNRNRDLVSDPVHVDDDGVRMLFEKSAAQMGDH